MAKTSVLTDDINGQTDDVRAVKILDIDGGVYTIDLGADSRDDLAEALAPFLDAATKRPSTADRTRTAAVREWARENGFPDLGARGPIPDKAFEDYDAAHAS